ncbi:hypothetical protein HU200_030989 [Digitaria exilis]|uniref:TSL-kinase interacting protein 1 n=1 Tax=Digitaria exilis TaxID=1010633 RepID=A0A835BRA0_9POAL|nr:hypothetical protein HU200_030989 [Digitaria exilis]
MKAHKQRCDAPDTGATTKSSGNKLPSLKAGAHINKSSGNIAAKRRKGAGFSPESYTESKIASKTGGLVESLSDYSIKISARPPNHSGKIKLQLFPIDETIQKIMQHEKHNPYLELILAPRKKISSVVQHLNTKWGSSQCTKGELMLFPNDARLDTIASSAKWTIQDSCTAADVHIAVGSPSTFRLRYGWFGPNLKESSGPSLASVQSADKIIGTKPGGDVFSEQKLMAGSGEFPSNFVVPSILDNTNAVQQVDNQSKVTPLSWLDSISNISFGALLSEAAPSQDSKQLPSQNNLSLQQIPATCDSFDAAIASLIARQQVTSQPRVSNPSLWEAEETCHAFAFQNHGLRRATSSVPDNNGAAMTSSVLGSIPETGTDDQQQCSTNGEGKEARTEPSPSNSDLNAKPEISMHESTGVLGHGSSLSGFLSGTDSLGLSGLLANSLDAFHNFSVS